MQTFLLYSPRLLWRLTAVLPDKLGPWDVRARPISKSGYLPTQNRYAASSLLVPTGCLGNYINRTSICSFFIYLSIYITFTYLPIYIFPYFNSFHRDPSISAFWLSFSKIITWPRENSANDHNLTPRSFTMEVI